MEQEIYWIWLSSLPRIQVRQVKELGKVYESLEALWQDWREISKRNFEKRRKRASHLRMGEMQGEKSTGARLSRRKLSYIAKANL